MRPRSSRRNHTASPINKRLQPATLTFGQPYQQPYAPNTITLPGKRAGRTRVSHTPVVTSSKPDEMTASGQNVCGRCDRRGHGASECYRRTMRCNSCGQMGHYPGEHVKLCHFCGQPGHTIAKCPSKPANQA
ncbi:hypothetical protein H257_18376 [Aphanomyces astaci]|uniref:CCHC-type domain-containing protein n=1 Tax=Aphanomyces astaci TaxID=112090 RepID=W4FD85_APHAT|nr:hypothetical protein H257_18376 [Aphanomyces astaci]ETV64801.1 hypothetical protein H257_18376 [Aphanomyces astaci]|eukprot:XP_009845720.1 hypothetical protein H257_18376 [Aphanomyces astaci]